MNSVETLMEAERWDDVVAAVEIEITKKPEDPELLWIAGWANLQLERYTQARPYLHKAAELGPVDHFHYWALGLSLIELSDYVTAELWLLRSLALRETYRTRIALALAYYKQGLPEVAEIVHKEGVRLHPSSRGRLEAYADFLSDVGREEEAQKLYEEAQRLPEIKE